MTTLSISLIVGIVLVDHDLLPVGQNPAPVDSLQASGNDPLSGLVCRDNMAR